MLGLLLAGLSSLQIDDQLWPDLVQQADSTALARSPGFFSPPSAQVGMASTVAA